MSHQTDMSDASKDSETCLENTKEQCLSPSNEGSSNWLESSDLHDDVLPLNVENTYMRLHTRYAGDLCQNWIEETEPAKHTYKDIYLAAFLIELWRNMYGVNPVTQTSENEADTTCFPGFVDIACGSGVLVYVLLMEGYSGHGIDAYRRKTWDIFPTWIRGRLAERIFVPKPFADVLEADSLGVDTCTGDFPRDTFIISSHADELTVWTPLVAALTCPASPLPFLIIPCCSHSLSGARYRYPAPMDDESNNFRGKISAESSQEPGNYIAQPASGDLKALRAAKAKEKTEEGMLTSMYGSLTAKTVSIAEEVGYQVESTVLPIPCSIRNAAIVGGRLAVAHYWKSRAQIGGGMMKEPASDATENQELVQTVNAIVERECSKDGGTLAAASAWAEHARVLHEGQETGIPPH